MVRRESATTEPNRLVCRKCQYTTDVLRPTCPECGGDMVYAADAAE